MKPALSFLVVSLFSIFAQAAPHSHHGPPGGDPPGIHGMLMVGESEIFLSHLPMFHSPHDYQALFKVAIAPQVYAAYLKAKKANPNSYFTLVPSAFVLPEMVAKPKPFLADLYLGHFERGGQKIAVGFPVQIKKVLHFEKLMANGPKPKMTKYLLFGNAKEQFLAHKIHAKPDFDQILPVSVPGALAVRIGISSLLEIAIPGVPPTLPLEAGMIKAAVLVNGEPVKASLKAQQEIYLEFGDLSN